MPPDAFISYSSRDRIVADAVCAGLEAAGVRCWIAPRDIPPGAEIDDAIIHAIQSARLLVLVLSASSSESRRVQREVSLASSRGIIVVPFRIEETTVTPALEYFLGSSHWIDATSPPFAERLNELVNVISDQIARERRLERLVRSEPGGSAREQDRPPRQPDQRPAPSPPPAPAADAFDVFISYRREGGAAEARAVQAGLSRQGLRVFLDVDDLRAGHFDEALLDRIAETPNFILLLSPDCLTRCDDERDWLRREVMQALRCRRNIIPVELPGFSFPPAAMLPEELRPLERHQRVEYTHRYFRAMVETIVQYLKTAADLPPATGGTAGTAETELAPSLKQGAEPTPAGADAVVPQQSLPAHYITRPSDHAFINAIKRHDSLILVRGARQTGKTALLARGLRAAREAGDRVVFTDLQKFASSDMDTLESFLLALGETLADRLDLKTYPADVWMPQRSPTRNLERYMRRYVLEGEAAPLVWGIDEIDRLFSHDYAVEVFGLLRSWHNDTAADPFSPFRRLSLVIVSTVGEHLFITDPYQSPFNIGTRYDLTDFTPDEVAWLNETCGSPLASPEDVGRFYKLLGGHPYLVSRGLTAMAERAVSLRQLEETAAREDGLFADHLRQVRSLLERNPDLAQAVQRVLRGAGTDLTWDAFNRARAAGLLTGESERSAALRSPLYAAYLGRLTH